MIYIFWKKKNVKVQNVYFECEGVVKNIMVNIMVNTY